MAAKMRVGFLLAVVTALLTPAVALSQSASCVYAHTGFTPSGSVEKAVRAAAASGAIPRVHIVYMVPSDRSFNAEYAARLREAALALRLWYWNEMGPSTTSQPGDVVFPVVPPPARTFWLDDPVVTVVHTAHPARYYSENPNGGLFVQFWNNVLGDAFPATGGSFYDPANVWAYYIDADPACGQCGGCGTSGVLVISANDFRGMTGSPWVPSCPGDFDSGGPGRYVGGLGHELGHAFGLPHPPGCDSGSSSCDHAALMWNGFRNYPDTYLRDDEIAILAESSFFEIPGDADRNGFLQESDLERALSVLRERPFGSSSDDLLSDCYPDGVVTGRDAACIWEVSRGLPHIQTSALDLDRNRSSGALSDGLLLLRHLFGFAGDSLVAGAVSADAWRTTPVEIADYVGAIDPALDVDGDGTVQPLTDGLLILRYLFGFRGEALVEGAIGAGATRSAAAIENYLNAW